MAELAKEISTQVKTLKKPEIKGGAVDGVVIGPDQVEDITKLPSREQLIGRVASLALAPAQRIVALANAPVGSLMSQLKTMSEAAGESEAAANPKPSAKTQRRNPPRRAGRLEWPPRPPRGPISPSTAERVGCVLGPNPTSKNVSVRLTHGLRMIMI